MSFAAGVQDFRAEKKLRWSQFAPAVVVSLILHAGLILGLLNDPIEIKNKEPREILPVRLYSQNPFTIEAEISPAESPSSQELNDADTESVEVEDSRQEIASSVNRIEEVVEESAAQTSAQTTPQTLPDENAESGELLSETVIQPNSVPAIRAPSVLTVQESLQQLKSSSRSQLYSYNCNPLEEDAGIKDCDLEAAYSDEEQRYLPAERGLVYRALNPTRELSRSDRALNVVSTQSRELAERVGSLDLPAGLSDYVMEEVEAGITHSSDLGNRAVQHMIDSTDNSAAAAMARDLLNDPWVEKQSKLNKKRQVRLPN